MKTLKYILFLTVCVVAAGGFILASAPEPAKPGVPIEYEARQDEARMYESQGAETASPNVARASAQKDTPVAARNPAPVQTASQAPIMPRRAVQSIPPVQKCMNLGGAMEAPREGDWGYTIRQKDLVTIKQTGFDTIRLPVKWSAHTQTTAPYKIDAAILARTDQIIGRALQQNLKVILDVHHYTELMENPPAHIPRLTAIWEQLGAHYAGYSDALMFELINEPHDKLTITETNRLNAHLLQTVRRTNPNRWVVLGSGNWNSLEGMTPGRPESFVPPRDPRIITTFHYYDDFNFTHQGAEFYTPFIPMGQTFGSRAQKQAITNDMAIARDFGLRTGTPVLLGEFGVFDKVPDSQRAAWTRHVREQAEANNMGWCYWEWATSFKMYDTGKEQFVPGLKDALFR